jgi:hypothetical protein
MPFDLVLGRLQGVGFDHVRRGRQRPLEGSGSSDGWWWKAAVVVMVVREGDEGKKA